jgi:thiosulfate dehydrogenase
MKNRRLYLFPAILLGAMFSLAHANDGDSATNPGQFNAFYAPAYRLPDAAGLSSSAASGKNLIHSTYKYLGAESSIRAANGRPYVGNRLACTNCHLADGTQPNASPLIVVANKYAAPGIFNSRSNTMLDVPNRINSCMERSLAGEALPRDSQQMKDIVAYLEFLATGIQPGYTFRQVAGQEYPKMAFLARAANPARGQEIFHDHCKGCHEDDGQGTWNNEQKRYDIPAVWGSNSFGLMSGMGRLATAATMVWGTMPRDQVNALDPATRMTQEDAWDVAAYLLSKSHPFDVRYVKDWSGTGPDGMPNWLRKASSASYDFTMPRSNYGAATNDPTKPPMFPKSQHTFGPFQPIEDALKSARNARGFP